jgi:glutaminase
MPPPAQHLLHTCFMWPHPIQKGFKWGIQNAYCAYTSTITNLSIHKNVLKQHSNSTNTKDESQMVKVVNTYKARMKKTYHYEGHGQWLEVIALTLLPLHVLK